MSRTTIWAGRTFVIAAVLGTGVAFLRTESGIALNPLGVVLTGVTNAAVVVFLVLLIYDVVRWVARRRRSARDPVRRDNGHGRHELR